MNSEPVKEQAGTMIFPSLDLKQALGYKLTTEKLVEVLRLINEKLDEVRREVDNFPAYVTEEPQSIDPILKELDAIARRVHSNHHDPLSLRSSVEEWASAMKIASRRAHPELRGKS